MIGRYWFYVGAALTVGGVAIGQFIPIIFLAILPGIVSIYFDSNLWIFGSWFLPRDLQNFLRRHRKQCSHRIIEIQRVQAHGACSFLPLARSGWRFLGTGAGHDPASTVENMSWFSRLL